MVSGRLQALLQLDAANLSTLRNKPLILFSRPQLLQQRSRVSARGSIGVYICAVPKLGRKLVTEITTAEVLAVVVPF